MKDTILDFKPEELMNVITHKEACECIIDLKLNIVDMENQFKKLYSHAKSLELENTMLIKSLPNT